MSYKIIAILVLISMNFYGMLQSVDLTKRFSETLQVHPLLTISIDKIVELLIKNQITWKDLASDKVPQDLRLKVIKAYIDNIVQGLIEGRYDWDQTQAGWPNRLKQAIAKRYYIRLLPKCGTDVAGVLFCTRIGKKLNLKLSLQDYLDEGFNFTQRYNRVPHVPYPRGPSLDLSAMQLDRLNGFENMLKKYPQFRNIRSLFLVNNHLTSLPTLIFQQLPEIAYIDVAQNPLSEQTKREIRTFPAYIEL